ncbi:MAG: hypothetical protein Q8O84_04505 [Nanoarchaeota archaeon]|nr:hypothetical protein [Nanoarchaeota archaeon]
MKKKVTLSIDAKTYEGFQKYCEENAVMLSKKIELWIKDFMGGERLHGGQNFTKNKIKLPSEVGSRN